MSGQSPENKNQHDKSENDLSSSFPIIGSTDTTLSSITMQILLIPDYMNDHLDPSI